MCIAIPVGWVVRYWFGVRVLGGVTSHVLELVVEAWRQAARSRCIDYVLYGSELAPYGDDASNCGVAPPCSAYRER